MKSLKSQLLRTAYTGSHDQSNVFSDDNMSVIWTNSYCGQRNWIVDLVTRQEKYAFFERHEVHAVLCYCILPEFIERVLDTSIGQPVLVLPEAPGLFLSFPQGIGRPLPSRINFLSVDSGTNIADVRRLDIVRIDVRGTS